MPQMAFTHRKVESLTAPAKPKEARYFERRERGVSLMLNVSYTGAKTWHLLFYRSGKPTTKKLGTFPAMTVANARAEANKSDTAKAAASANAGTFRQIAERWIVDYVDKKGLRSKPDLLYQLNNFLYPAWGNRRIFDIRRSEINKLLEDIEHRKIRYDTSVKRKNNVARVTIGGLARADAVLATIRSIMGWYAIRDDDYSSPIVKGMNRDKREPKAKARKRFLADGEIKAVWEACESQGTFGAFVRVLLLTGQRRNKVADMKRDHVVDGIWTIPEEDREKGNIGSVRLPLMARDIIDRLPRIDGNAYVFPASFGTGRLNSFSQSKAELDEKLSGMPAWVLHDLRRTSRTLMSRLGVPKNIAERTLGHVIQGVEGRYDRYGYFDEKSDALRRVADHIVLILNPPDATNVLPLRPEPAKRRATSLNV